MKFVFYTPGCFDTCCGFGCASFGFSDAPDPGTAGVRIPEKELIGFCANGSYEECLAAIPDGVWQAGIVLLGNGGGENEFIRRLSEKVRCPLTGGAAAIDPATGRSALVSGGEQASVFLIRDSRYEVTVESRNIHESVYGVHEICMHSPRVFDTVDGVDALTWYNAEREKHGISESDFEHLTFSDKRGVNAHLSVVDGRLCAGRDLSPLMLLREADASQVWHRMHAFYDDPDAVVFGCAGLKGILPEPLMTGGCGLFMFGEVVTVDGVSEFGNLMLSKLCVRER